MNVLDYQISRNSSLPNLELSGHITECSTLCKLFKLQHLLFVGSVRLYDYENKTSLCSAKYSCGATSLLWLPKNVSGNHMLV